MFEIWRHSASGDRYLVAVRDGVVNVAAGPLTPDQEPRATLEQHLNQHHNPRALLDLRKFPEDYTYEYTTDKQGRAIPVTDQPIP